MILLESPRNLPALGGYQDGGGRYGSGDATTIGRTSPMIDPDETAPAGALARTDPSVFAPELRRPSMVAGPREIDARLHERICAGDQKGLAEAYDAFGRAVYSVALRVLNDAGMAEDVVQLVFLRLWDNPHRFDPTRGALKSFLFREAHSRAVERVRAEEARKARERRDEREFLHTDVDVEREVVDLVRSERVRAALDNLTEGERDAINLAYFGGHTYRDVARLLDLPEGTVKSRIRLGLTKLAEQLEGLGWGGPDVAG